VKHTGIVLAALAPLALAGAWWALQEEGSLGAGARPSATTAAASAAAARAGAAAPAATGRRQQAAPDDPFLSRGLRHQLEALWLEAGDAASPADLRQRLMALAPSQFAAVDLPRALQLIERYVDYRIAVSKLKPPADLSDPDALRQAMQERSRLRRGHFTEDEYEALFAQEEALDRYTIARLEILRNGGLTPQQQQAALREAEHELAEGERQARADSVVHLAVAAQTAGFEAAGLTDAQRFAQRRSAYGDGAAQRLAQLDTAEREWQARLDQYAAAKSASAVPDQLEALKQQLFTAEERLRVEAALALRSRKQ